MHKETPFDTEDDDIKRRWAEYYRTLHESRDGEDTPYQRGGHDMEPPPLRSEVEWAMRGIKGGNTPGVDNIPVEVWKATEALGVEVMWRLCTKVLEEEE